MSYTAKSVILDIADNHGGPYGLGLRQVDFWSGGAKIILGVSDFMTYATSTFTIGSYEPSNAFDTYTSKTGGSGDWLSAADAPTNQRLICVFDSPVTFDEIRVNNTHYFGDYTSDGVNNVVITISDDVITDTTYNAAISNSTEIFDGVFDEHVASDVEDEQILTLGEVVVYNITGTVKEQGSFVQRTVRLYKRSDGSLVSETQSDSGDGSFSLSGAESGNEYSVVVLDDITDGTDYNALIFDRITVS